MSPFSRFLEKEKLLQCSRVCFWLPEKLSKFPSMLSVKPPGRIASSSALQESDFNTIVGNAPRTLLVHANPKAVLCALPVSSLYSPSGQSTHSKQHVGSPSIMPFLVPGRQSMLQLEKGTCKKRIRRGLTVKYFKNSLPTAGLELTPRV